MRGRNEEPSAAVVSELLATRACFGLTDEDERSLERLAEEVAPLAHVVLAQAYGRTARAEAGPPARGLEPRELQELRAAHERYVRSLGGATARPEYIRDAMRAGEALDRAGLDPGLYAAAHASLLRVLTEYLARVTDPGRTPVVTAALARVHAFEAHAVLRGYCAGREERLARTVDVLAAERRRVVDAARRDSLTAVDVRPFALRSLERERTRSIRFGHPFSVLFVDVDRFKLINDAHGHDAGDEVLRHVARIMRTAVRPQDTIGRYGGDEFVVGLVQADAQTAARIAERIRRRVAQERIPARGGSARVTVSIGTASLTRARESLSELVRAADAALYEAKSAGRNHVVAASAPPREPPPLEARA